jgi:uncharacterized protein YjiS (DUF1127 family)
MADEGLVRSNVLPFRPRPAPTKFGERYEERHQSSSLIHDAVRLDAHQRSSHVIVLKSLRFVLQRSAVVVLSMIARSLRHAPATADFQTMNNHMLKDIGLSPFDANSAVSRRDRWS